MEQNPVSVKCYSGYTLNERPSCIITEGRDIQVKSIEKEWREPGCRYFRVRTEDDRLFRLCYYVSTDSWRVTELMSMVRKGGE